MAVRRVPVVLLGVGGVGRALLRQMLARRDYHATRFGVRFDVVAVADSRGAVVMADGLEDDALRQILAHKDAGKSLADFPDGYYQGDPRDIVDLVATPETVVVDVTATDATYDALMLAMQRRSGIVLANKIPLAGPYERAEPLFHYALLRYETTVGSAVPVITTLKRLLASGETIHRIQGSLSGSLGYIMTAVEEGVAFSKAVLRAKEMGYTEPDPREDLLGRDVARKALIMARTMGWRMEMGDVQVEPLIPEEWASWPEEDFWAELFSLDDDFYSWRDAAQARHEALRYVARVEDGRLRVGIEFVPQDSPLGRLHGSDNLVEFYTEYYDPGPLALQGRGAGVEATAAGVFSDMVELALQ